MKPGFIFHFPLEVFRAYDILGVCFFIFLHLLEDSVVLNELKSLYTKMTLADGNLRRQILKKAAERTVK